MSVKLFALFCLLLVAEIQGFIKLDLGPSSSSSQPNVLESIQKNLDRFRKCMDESLAQAVNEVNEKQLQPVFTTVGDSLNRVSKAFDDLTASTKRPGIRDYID